MGTIGSRCIEEAKAKLEEQRSALPPEAPVVRRERVESEIFAARSTLRLALAVAGARVASDLPAFDNFHSNTPWRFSIPVSTRVS